MSTIEIGTTLNLIKMTNRQLDLPLPAPLADTLEQADQFTPLPAIDAEAIGARVLDHLANGKDPLDDKEVQRAALTLALRGIDLKHLHNNRRQERRTAALREAAPTLIETWATVVQAAGEAIAKARADLPGIDLQDDRALVGLATGKLTTWGAARDALNSLEKVVQGWQALVRGLRLARIGDDSAPLIVAALDLDQLEALPQRTIRATATAGHALQLATPEQYTERVNATQGAAAIRSRDRAEASQLAGFGDRSPAFITRQPR